MYLKLNFLLLSRIAFIEFSSSEEVQAALDAHQNEELDGRSLFLDKMGSRQKDRRSSGGRQSFGGGGDRRQSAGGSFFVDFLQEFRILSKDKWRICVHSK